MFAAYSKDGDLAGVYTAPPVGIESISITREEYSAKVASCPYGKKAMVRKGKLVLVDEEITATPEPEVSEVEAVRAKRRADYPSVGDALDAIAKWLATETEFSVPKELKSWATQCMAVKRHNPMPEGKK